VIGAGPAGTVCATLCARAGLKVTIIERSAFPRHKVCGDCLNPACWDIFDELGISEEVRQLPHAKINRVIFESIAGKRAEFSLPSSESRPEIACRRELLDALLLDTALRAGCTVVHEAPLTRINRCDNGDHRWLLSHHRGKCSARWIVAADGRNSTTAKLLRLQPNAERKASPRVAWQTHAPLGINTRTDAVTLKFLKNGYCGIAPVDDHFLNVCLVAEPRAGEDAKNWATQSYGIPDDSTWSSIAPLQRADYPPAGPGWLLVGDAARVVEPFTGEGIYYALESARLAARALCDNGASRVSGTYLTAHALLYSGQLWINRLARLLVRHPSVGSKVTSFMRHFPAPASLLLGKVTKR